MFNRVLLIGSGSIGRRHLANLRAALPGVGVTLLRRPGAPALGTAVSADVDRIVDRIDAALEPRPDLAVIATPATTHLGFAMALADASIPMLIEKPLSTDLDGCSELADRCRANGVPVVVGYALRYHPGYIALEEHLRGGSIGRPLLARAEVGQYLPDWRPGADYRRGVTARRDLGGGALLELSHELDLVRALLGMPRSVSAHLDRVGDLAIDVEDTVDMVTVHQLDARHRAVATSHLDLLQRPARRRLGVTGTEGALELDFVAGSLRLQLTDRTCTEIPVAPTTDRNAIYRAEIADLLEAARGAPPRVGLEDGISTQRIIDAARRSASDGCVVAIHNGDR